MAALKHVLVCADARAVHTILCATDSAGEVKQRLPRGTS